MSKDHWEKYIESFDERRDAVIPGGKAKTIQFCIEHFISVAQTSIEKHGSFSVALSGGSTPKAIYEGLCTEENVPLINWSKVLLFWSDERSVPPDHSESNFKMAMDAGFSKLPIPQENIFRMKAEEEIENHAIEYEQLLETKLPNGVFDLVMLGMGEDGHTASLFPETHGLHPGSRLVVANYVPQLSTWRMTLTFNCINRARHIVIYVLGKGKTDMLKKVLSKSYLPDHYPVQKIGTSSNKALWIADNEVISNIYLT